MKKLKQQRARVKAQLTRMENSLQNVENMSAAEAQIRLKNLEQIMQSFNAIQDEIEEKVQPAVENQQDEELLNAEEEAERQLFESRYYAVAALAKQLVDAAQLAQGTHQANQNNLSRETNGGTRKTKLPEIKLAEFDGEYTKWIVFKNQFEGTIHNNADLTPMQKHQYLIGVLQGEARAVIERFDISGENYASAWQLLKDAYDDRKMLVENHIEALLQMPSISRTDRAESIRKLIWHIQTHISSLQTLGLPVIYWDTLIIHIARKELDYGEQKDWQNLIKGRQPDNMPTLIEFIKFLTERCHTLRVITPLKGKTATTGKQRPFNEVKGDKRYEKKVALTISTVTCKYCNKGHTVNKCEEFLTLSVEDRKREVLKKKLCINCLNLGHIAQDCRSSKCKKCSGRHNTLLHKEEKQITENKVSSDAPVVTHCTDATDQNGIADVYCIQKSQARVILSTARVFLKNSKGETVNCRALLDPGSQSNLITADLAKKLKLPISNQQRTIGGINQSHTNVYQVLCVQLRAIQGEFSEEIECLVLPSITEELPQTKIDVTRIVIPRNIQLADPGYSEPGTVDLLLGAGLYWKSS